MTMDKIRIGWKDYAIVNQEKQSILTVDGGTCYGEIRHEPPTIYLNAENDEQQNKATLIHEIIHGISDHYSIDFSEDIVTRLANAIVITLQQNDLVITKKE